MVRTKAGGGGCRKGAGRAGLRGRWGWGAAPWGRRSPLREARRGGGNPVCVRPVPAWQRGIGEFLRLPQENRAPGGEAAGSSGLGPAAKKEGPGGGDCQPTEQEPAVCPGGQEGQWHPGLYQP
uniref:PCNA-associated factor n=1 Tax=Strix occidentalis caurina TaxID=311401 RepID=A0A8D0EK59_STROC